MGHTATAEPGQSERRSRQSALVLVTGPMKRSDRVATLDEAKAQFQMSWDAWKAWAKLEEVPDESLVPRPPAGHRARFTPPALGALS